MFTTYLVLHVLKLASHCGSIASYILPSITRSTRITKGIEVNHMRRLVLVDRRIGVPAATTQIQS